MWLLKRLIVSRILDKLNSTYIYCENCGSPFIKMCGGNKGVPNSRITEYTVECLDCGRWAKVQEKWQ